jgi:hypothetical protein
VVSTPTLSISFSVHTFFFSFPPLLQPPNVLIVSDLIARRMPGSVRCHRTPKSFPSHHRQQSGLEGQHHYVVLQSRLQPGTVLTWRQLFNTSLKPFGRVFSMPACPTNRPRFVSLHACVSISGKAANTMLSAALCLGPISSAQHHSFFSPSWFNTHRRCALCYNNVPADVHPATRPLALLHSTLPVSILLPPCSPILLHISH